MSSDEDLRGALYQRDESLIMKVLLRTSGERLSDLLKKTESDLVWFERLKDLILESAALCACGQIAIDREDRYCAKHVGAGERYAKAMKAWEEKQSDANARELMCATVENGLEIPEGKCYLPPCDVATGYDYDGRSAWCDEHSRLFNLAKRGDNVALLANLRKKRGKDTTHQLSYHMGCWQRHEEETLLKAKRRKTLTSLPTIR